MNLGEEKSPRSRSRSPFGDRHHSPGKPNAIKHHCIFVSNIPLECRWTELKFLFTSKVGDVLSFELSEDENGEFEGCGTVEFKDREAAEKAVDVMHNHNMRGKELNVKLVSTVKEEDQTCTHNSEKEIPNSTTNTYGLSSEFLKSLGIYGDLNSKIFIFNLDSQVTKEKLEEVFEIAGKLVKTELDVDEEGNSKGQGTVQYEHPLEAVQAISLFNGQRLYSRIINVCMEKIVNEKANTLKLPSGLHGIGKGLGANGQPIQFNKKSTDSPTNGISYAFSKSIEDGHGFRKDDKNSNDDTSKGAKGKEEAKSEQLVKLDCAVCLQTCVQPVELPCHHIFCYLCVKGIDNQRCPMCRQDIPNGYMYNPHLIAVQQSTVAFEGSYQWFYEGRNGWWQYDDRTSSEIETAFKDKKLQCEIQIAGYLYTIDLQRSFQVRKCDPGRRRQIKRDLVTIPKKGVAGIRINQATHFVSQQSPQNSVITPAIVEDDPDVIVIPTPVREDRVMEVIDIAEDIDCQSATEEPNSGLWRPYS